MKISLNWLKDFVRLDSSAEEIAHAITFLGFEVEGVSVTGAPRLSQVVVGEVLTRSKHPNADKLSVCTVDIGPGGVKTIVCGAQNYKVGDRVPVALPGAVLPGNFTIKQSKIRGELSDGMMCSAREIGLGEDQSGLLILEGRPDLGKPINEVLPPGDTVFDIEITPNRPDCLSHLGVARELAAWFDKPLVYPKIKYSAEAAEKNGAHPALRGVTVDSPSDCPLYLAYSISGVKIGPSPAWIQERLKSAGLRPVNNVVDAGNFVLLEYGQPLHAFDASKLRGGRIVVRRAADGEKIVTLDGKERVLNERMLVIADAERPVVVAGVMGGENSGVSLETTELVLECAIFKPQSIRWTSRRLGISSDSSYRYERGVDPHMAPEAAARALDLIVETAGGRVVGSVIKVGGEAPWKREIVLSAGFVRERLGFEIADSEMKTALEALEIAVVREEVGQDHRALWTLSIPSWRDDLDRPIDLVEEILRLHGTEQIPAALVQSPGLLGDDDPLALFNRRATEYLVGHDFHECANLTLRSAREVATWVSAAAAQELALANPFVEDQSHLRPTLITGLLESLKLNQSRGVAVSRLAETGRIFVENNGQNLEFAAVAFVIAEDGSRHWKPREKVDFYTAKHHVASLAAFAGVELSREAVSATDGAHPGWQVGHSASAGSIEQGWQARFGLLDLALVKSTGVEGQVFAGIFAILPARLQPASTRRRFTDVAVFPAALRDVALVVDTATLASKLQSHLEEAAKAAIGSAFSLEKVAVFDVYQGKGLPEGKKSLAFSLVFRAPDRTLTDDEVNAAFQKIQDEIVRVTGCQIRK